MTAQCPAAAYYTKWVIAVDDDVDPTDFNQVMWALSTRCNPADDLDFLRNTWSTGLDPSQYPPDAAALRIEGADQRLQAAPLYQAVSCGDPAAGRNL